jgi:Zn-dependent peptidase ImmA (M78 family)/transcriptional regulator with XRE-family HTH domain
LPDPKQLEDAVRLAPLVSADRIRLAREIRRWTQRGLADEMALAGHSVTPAAISQLEKGHSTPSGKTLLSVAEATEFPLEYFVRRNADSQVDGFFRSLKAAPAKERKWAVAQAHLLHDFVRAMDHYVDLPEVDVPGYRLTSGDQEEIEEIALVVRSEWGIPPGPIENVTRELERHGVVATRFELGDHGLDAFSVWFADRPVVVLGADKGSTVRSRFDAAHELGHGVLHEPSQVGEDGVERQAHRFAAAFLMPRDDIRPYLAPSVDWRQLMDVKAMWGVSLSALLIRARDLDILSPSRYVSAMKYMSARGWRKDEPGDRLVGAPEEPRLVRAALRRLKASGMTHQELAAEAGLPARDVEELVSTKA